jgi:hypothetical protein
MILEDLNKGLTELGFEITDDNYKIEITKETPVILYNGQQAIKQDKVVAQLKYIGSGGELDENGDIIEGRELHGFDINDTTIYVTDVNDMKGWLNL